MEASDGSPSWGGWWGLVHSLGAGSAWVWFMEGHYVRLGAL